MFHDTLRGSPTLLLVTTNLKKMMCKWQNNLPIAAPPHKQLRCGAKNATPDSKRPVTMMTDPEKGKLEMIVSRYLTHIPLKSSSLPSD
jgi:hypothetical protein